MANLYLTAFVSLIVLGRVVGVVLEQFGVTGMTHSKGRYLSKRSVLASYLVVSTVMIMCVCALGWYGWMNDDIITTAITPYQRLFQSSSNSHTMGHLMLAYQLWSVVMSVQIKEFRTVPFLGQHVCTALLAALTTRSFCHYWLVFFFGIAETSTLPLVIIEAVKHFPELGAKFRTLHSASIYTFAALFLALRGIAWPIFSVYVWMDGIPFLMGEEVHEEIRSRGKWSIAFLLFGLTLLQFLWAKMIIEAALGLKREKESRVKVVLEGKKTE